MFVKTTHLLMKALFTEANKFTRNILLTNLKLEGYFIRKIAIHSDELNSDEIFCLIRGNLKDAHIFGRKTSNNYNEVLKLAANFVGIKNKIVLKNSLTFNKLFD